MGNQNSSRRREIRRNTRKWQHFADNHDESARGAAVIEQNRRVSRVSRKKEYERITFTVVVGQSRGFIVEEDSLMIIDITNPVLQGQMLPEGSIIREIDGQPVYDNEQFLWHTENKKKYTMTVLTPKTTGVWKVCPSKNYRRIVVHNETLVVLSTTIHGFPRDSQVIKCVNGCPVLSYTEYQNLTGEKTKFFITVVPAKRDDISETSIQVFLETVNRIPDSISEHDMVLIQRALEESLTEVNSELNMRMQRLRPEIYNSYNRTDLEPNLDHPPAGSAQVIDNQGNEELRPKRSGKKRGGKSW